MPFIHDLLYRLEIKISTMVSAIRVRLIDSTGTAINPSTTENQTNGNQTVRIVNSGNIPVAVDSLTKSLVNLDWEHSMVHSEKTYTISYRAPAVAINGYLDIHLTGVTNDAHLKVNYSSEGKAIFNSYVGTTYTNEGTTLTPWNRCICATNVATTLVRLNPTINVLGSKRTDEFVGSAGAAVTRAGGVGGSNIETIINPGCDILLRLQNISGSTSDLQMTLNFYELLPE